MDEYKTLLPRNRDYYLPKRYVFSLLSFIACCLAASNNISLSIAIVSMVRKSPGGQNSTLVEEISIPVHEVKNSISRILSFDLVGFEFYRNDVKTDSTILNWNGEIIGSVLGAVYYGQLVSFLPGGRMAELYSGKNTLIICIIIASISSFLCPMAAMWSPYAFIGARVLVGVGTGPIVPIVYYMLSKWIPDHERSFHASIIVCGYGIGAFLTIIISGYQCSSSFLGGWPLVFYTGALSGIIWILVCVNFMFESPCEHPTISLDELSYIRNGLSSQKPEKILKIPWKEMVFSLPLWSLAIGYFGQFWLLGFFCTVMGTYVGTVLNLPIEKTGLLSCFPHLLRSLVTLFVSYPVNLLLKRKLVSVGFVRKGATLINSFVSCGALLGITFVGRNITFNAVLLILGSLFGEFVTFGVCIACIDIAPNLSGTVSGILNIVGVVPFILVPVLVGWITDYGNSIEKWHNVFYISTILVTICSVIFALFGDLEPQPWGAVLQSNFSLGNVDSTDKEALEKSKSCNTGL